MRRATLIVAVILAAVSGCAPDGGQATGDIPLPGQQWALEDGRVTAAEYHTADRKSVV